MSSSTSTTTNNVLQELLFLPPSLVEKLEAGAFRSLCHHLQERSEEVQNIDLMTLSGFCRNCLAKWMVMEARTISKTLERKNDDDDDDGDTRRLQQQQQQQSLDALGYEEAAHHVYGMPYEEWKNRYSKQVPDETMQKFNQSKGLWAKHDKDLLTKRAERPSTPTTMKLQNAKRGSSSDASASARSSAAAVACIPSGDTKETKATGASSLLSNVCCQDLDELQPLPPSSSPPLVTVSPPPVSRQSRELPPYHPPVPPKLSFSLGILTVSDRASRGEYETGDLSGPAVRVAVESVLKLYSDQLHLTSVSTAIVPDDRTAIQQTLLEWTDHAKIQLILTTGGTGFSPRDVTPEATNGIVDRVCDGLVTFCTMECAKVQPLASLSRGSAGVRGKSLIVNLPGNPKGVKEIVPILLPLALHAVKDLC